jgi:hypothetical protein
MNSKIKNGSKLKKFNSSLIFKMSNVHQADQQQEQSQNCQAQLSFKMNLTIKLKIQKIIQEYFHLPV